MLETQNNVMQRPRTLFSGVTFLLEIAEIYVIPDCYFLLFQRPDLY